MKTNNFGYLNISKSIKLTELDNNLEYLGLFIYLSMYGQYEDKTTLIKGHEITIEKGQTLFFQKHLSEKFGISIGKINKMLFRLKKYGLCEIKNTNKYSIFEPKKDFIFEQAGKQNENKMKTKGNNINNNINKNNIYIGYEKIFFEITGKKEYLETQPKIDLKTFQQSFENYYCILNSEKTYYNVVFSLNQFVSDTKHAKKFLNAKIEDFLDFSKKGVVEEENKKAQRQKMIHEQRQKDEEEQKRLDEKAKKIKDIIDNFSDEERQKVEEVVKNEILKKKLPIVTTALFRAFFNDYVFKNYIKDKQDIIVNQN